MCVVLKRHRSIVEFLSHDVVELILERLPVKSLVRFKSVSNKWKSIIESRRFQETQLIRRRQSRGPDSFFASFADDGDAPRFVFWSSIDAYTVSYPILGLYVSRCSCDGLLCLYSAIGECVSIVVNPATRWHQSFPLSSIQHLLLERFRNNVFISPIPKLGFGKDKLRGTYKAVFLYNSSEFGLDNVTTCEVFDFSTNAWRYLHPASPYRINPYHNPTYLDGSLYWLTQCEETKVLSFDLHTETFQVFCKAPFAHVADPHLVDICILDNRLCVSDKGWPNQEIWSLDSSGCNKTWTKMSWLDLTKTFSWCGKLEFALSTKAILDKNKLLIHDLHTKSRHDLLFKHACSVAPVYYFQSLISTLSN